MRKKFLRSILFVFILMICSAIVIGVKQYGKTTSVFYKFGRIGTVSMIENSGYNELKRSVDEKYTKEFVSVLNKTSNSLKNGMSEILGSEYDALTSEYNKICDDISIETKAFNESKEYVDLKLKLANLKAKIDSLDKSSKEECLEEFRGVLSEISTLNTTFNNTLKSKRERLFEIKGLVKELFIKNKEELINLRKNTMENTRNKLKELFLNYNVEVKELNEAFGVLKNENSYPFDINGMNDCLVAGKLETECFNEILEIDGNNSVIYSENTTKVLS